MSEPEIEPFDFDDWAALARSDPEAFERRRTQAITSAIDAASEPVRRRLVGLQWQVDQMRERTGSPLGACVKLSSMMWRHVAGPDGLLDSLDSLSRATEPARGPRARADVLPFAARPGRPLDDR